MAALTVKAARQSGFTLLELLVVMFIVAIIASALTVSLSGDATRQMQTQGETLYDALQAAADEAVLEGTEMGVYFTQTGYGFLRYDNAGAQWRIMQEKPFRPYEMPGDMTLALTLGKTSVALPSDAGKADRHPALIFLSSGSMTPFTLRIAVSESAMSTVMETDGITPIALRLENHK